MPGRDDIQPESVAHFRVIRKLGEGGMGVVYEAEDQKLGRRVALKVLPSYRMHDPQRRRRFLREARAAAAVRHGRIATVYEVGVDDDATVYIAMELVEGRTLRRIVDDDGPLDVDETLDVIIAVVEALASAHAEGVIHRDLKDDNLMRTLSGEIKLLDFGIAKLVQPVTGEEATADAVTGIGVPIGTPGYMSPEQARGDRVDARSDIFAVGATMVRLVTGALPFQGDSPLELAAAPLRQRPDLGDVPTRLAPIAERCLARHLSDRYPSCEELLADLRAARHRAAPSAKRWPLLAGAVLVGAASVLAAATVAFVASRPPDTAGSVATTSSPPTAVAPASQTDAARLRHRELTTHPASLGLTIGAISPDGARLAFSNSSGVFVRAIDGGDERRIAENPAAALKPIDWLEARDAIVCRSGGESPALSTLSLTGERQPLYAPAFMAAVSPDEERVAIAAGDGLRIVTLGGGDDRLVLPLPRREAQELAIRWSASGERLLLARPIDGEEGRTVRVETMRPSDDAPRLAFSDRALVGQTAYRTLLWLPDGRLVASITEPPPDNLGTNLWETWIDPESGAVSGPLKRLTNWPSSGLWYASASRDGKRVALSMLRPSVSILTAQLAGDHASLQTAPEPLPSDGSSHWPSAWLDDDTVVYTSNRRGRLDVFAHPIGDNAPRSLLSGEGHDTYADPGPAGDLLHWRVKWDADRSGVVSRLLLTKGDSSRELLVAPLETARFTFGSASPIGAGFRCTRDRTHCVVGHKQGGAFVIFALDLETGRGPQLAQVEDGGGLISWDLSPGGRRIALLEARLDHATSNLRIFERGRGSRDVAIDRSCSPTGLDWARDEELLLTCYDDGGHLLLRVGVDGTTTVLHRAAVPSELWQPLASPSGDRLMVRQDVTASSMWLVEGW